MTTLYIGVDPGKTGAVAIMSKESVWAVTVMPLMDKDVDWSALAAWIRENTGGPKVIACIEKVHSMPEQGVKSVFAFGFVTGAVHGILAAMDIPRYLVTPQAWKKEILAGTPQDKKAAIDYCTRVYSYVSLKATPRSTTPHTGIADAICLAEYGMRHYG
jgi:crossover junction endodeoxyribonuclease RuvC